MALGRRLAALSLIAAMGVGSILLWLGIPLGLVYLASQTVGSQDPSMGVYLGLAILIPALMFATARVLGHLDRLYGRLTGTVDDRRRQAAWLKSMRGERGSQHQRTVLDVVMIISVALALVAMAVWFFAFAGSSLPG